MKKTFEQYLSHVRYKDWDFNIGVDGDRLFLQIGFWERDLTDPLNAARFYQKCRKWMLSPHMTKSEIIQTAFKAAMTAEEHECRERFFYQNQPIFGPHFDVDAIADICAANRYDKRHDLPQEERAA